MRRPQKQPDEAGPSTSQTEIEEDPYPAQNTAHPPSDLPQGGSGQPQRHAARRVRLRLPWELSIAVLATLAMAGFLYWFLQEEDPQKRLFTDEQLALFNGEKNSPMYVSILGEVYDVSKGKRMYGQTYRVFLGKDASRAFVTGDFKRDLHDDTSGLSDKQCASLVEWREFYRNHKEYRFKGRLLGRFWNIHGNKRRALTMVEEQAARAEALEVAKKEADKHLVGCSSRWNQATGGAVWCSQGWHPRILYREPLVEGGEGRQRCACFESEEHNGIKKLYPNCAPEASECATSPPGYRPKTTQELLIEHEQHAERLQQMVLEQARQQQKEQQRQAERERGERGAGEKQEL